MKVLLVNGSPHQHGCTYTALAEIAHTLQEEGIDSEIFWIGNKPIGGCIGCHGCVKLGKCAFDDDPVNAFTAKAKTADGFIFGSPVLEYGSRLYPGRCDERPGGSASDAGTGAEYGLLLKMQSRRCRRWRGTTQNGASHSH